MWKIEYTKRFLKELAKLPCEIREKAEIIVFNDLMNDNPFELGFIEQMTGYTGKFKIRIGKYRIGITIEKSSKLIICERIVHRKNIYKVFP